MDACFRETRMPSKMTKEDMNNNPLEKTGDKIDSSAPGDEGLQKGEGCDNSDPEKAADEAEFLSHLRAISKSDITIAEEKSRLIALIKIKPQPKMMIKRLILTMAEVGVGKSNIFQSLFAQYLQLAKDRGEQEPSVGERVDETKKEKADHPTHKGEDSSDGTIPTSKLVARSKSETDIVLSTIGDDANEKEATDADETLVKAKKEVRKRRSSEGASAKPPKAESEKGARFLADLVANEEEAIRKTWHKMKL